ncbi:MAG: hypothetical protein ACJ8B6_05390 [Gemmatimonadales bacterium]
MQQLSVKRTLVKSPPELWSELSEVERLARHLDAFGEIKITRLEPESTVAWEGEGASGTVSIEPSGWGTKVTMTARVEGEDPVPEPEPAPEPEPQPPSPSEPAARDSASRRRLFARLFGWDRRRPAVAAEQPVWVAGAPVEPEPSPEPEPQPVAADEPAPDPEPDPDAPLTPAGAQAALEGVLEALGSAHHRPFSRG